MSHDIEAPKVYFTKSSDSIQGRDEAGHIGSSFLFCVTLDSELTDLCLSLLSYLPGC